MFVMHKFHVFFLKVALSLHGEGVIFCLKLNHRKAVLSMVNQFNPYAMPYPQALQTFPQQTIPTANGKASVGNIKLAPNSSMLIADSTLPIIYRCVSDSLGNVTTDAFDISPHKDEEQVQKEQTDIMIADLVRRIERLENESVAKWSKSSDAEHGTDKTDDEYDKSRKQSTGSNKPVNAKQS